MYGACPKLLRDENKLKVLWTGWGHSGNNAEPKNSICCKVNRVVHGLPKIIKRRKHVQKHGKQGRNTVVQARNRAITFWQLWTGLAQGYDAPRHGVVMFGRPLVMFGRRLVMFGTRLVMFGTRWVMFGRRLVMFGTRLVMFETRRVMFGRRLVMFGTRLVMFWRR